MEQQVNNAQERSSRKVRSGQVVSDCQDKTIVVEVPRLMPHPLYGKVMRQIKKYYAHDENNESKVGDKVEIMETRPVSKLKRWRLKSITQRAVSD